MQIYRTYVSIPISHYSVYTLILVSAFVGTIPERMQKKKGMSGVRLVGGVYQLISLALYIYGSLLYECMSTSFVIYIFIQAIINGCRTRRKSDARLRRGTITGT